MKYRNLALVFLLGALLLIQAVLPAAAETGTRTVLLKVHVPFAGG